MTKPCAHCGADFESRTARGTYCSGKCRAAAGYLRRNGVTLPPPALRIAPPLADDDGEPVTLSDRVLAELRDLGRDTTVEGLLLLILARAIEHGQHSGSGLKALSSEMTRVWALVRAASTPEAETPFDQLRRDRDVRRDATGPQPLPAPRGPVTTATPASALAAGGSNATGNAKHLRPIDHQAHERGAK